MKAIILILDGDFPSQKPSSDLLGYPHDELETLIYQALPSKSLQACGLHAA